MTRDTKESKRPIRCASSELKSWSSPSSLDFLV